MDIPADKVKELRERTGIGFMECKGALREAKGDLEEAVKILRKRGLALAKKRAGRAVSEGTVGSYIHAGGKIGVLIEVNCETDFVARNEDFLALVKDLTMQIAAYCPKYVRREDVPEEVVEQEREIIRSQFASSGKPPKVVDKIIEGKLRQFYSEVCLLEQPFIKDDSITVAELIAEKIARIGEDVNVRRFVRYQVGEELSGEQK
jgi:elongation factor Ts